MGHGFVMINESGNEEQVYISSEEMASIVMDLHKSGLVEITYDGEQGYKVSRVTTEGCKYYTALHSMIALMEIEN